MSSSSTNLTIDSVLPFYPTKTLSISSCSFGIPKISSFVQGILCRFSSIKELKYILRSKPSVLSHNELVNQKIHILLHSLFLLCSTILFIYLFPSLAISICIKKSVFRPFKTLFASFVIDMTLRPFISNKKKDRSAIYTKSSTHLFILGWQIFAHPIGEEWILRHKLSSFLSTQITKLFSILPENALKLSTLTSFGLYGSLSFLDVSIFGLRSATTQCILTTLSGPSYIDLYKEYGLTGPIGANIANRLGISLLEPFIYLLSSRCKNEK